MNSETAEAVLKQFQYSQSGYVASPNQMRAYHSTQS
jgi:hypothetical protein